MFALAVAGLAVLGTGGRWAYCKARWPECVPTADEDELWAELTGTNSGSVTFLVRARANEQKILWADFVVERPDGRRQGCHLGEDGAWAMIDERWTSRFGLCFETFPLGEYVLTYKQYEVDRYVLR